MPAVAAREDTAGRQWDIVLVVAAGGGAGSLARWALTLLWPPSPEGFPVGTWVANTTGAFALGVLFVGVSALRRADRYVRPFLGVGVLGGYTTWSTAMLEVQTQVLAGQPARAAGYLLSTVVVGLAAAWAGAAVARLAVRRRPLLHGGRERGPRR